MDQKRVARQMSELFGVVMLLSTAVLVAFMIKQPKMVGVAIATMPVFFYGGVGLLGLGWIVTAGLFLDRAWARLLAGIAAVIFLVGDYFLAAGQLTRPLGSSDGGLIDFGVRLSVVLEVLLAAWGLTMLYLIFFPRSAAPVASSISVEVLNTK